MGSPHTLNYLPKAHLQIPSCWELGLQYVTFGETQIQSIAPDYSPNLMKEDEHFLILI